MRKAIKRILLPVDFSSDSHNALRRAADLAAVFRAEIVTVHVVEPVYVTEPYMGMAPQVGMFLDEQIRNAKAVLGRKECCELPLIECSRRPGLP